MLLVVMVIRGFWAGLWNILFSDIYAAAEDMPACMSSVWLFHSCISLKQNKQNKPLKPLIMNKPKKQQQAFGVVKSASWDAFDLRLLEIYSSTTAAVIKAVLHCSKSGVSKDKNGGQKSTFKYRIQAKNVKRRRPRSSSIILTGDSECVCVCVPVLVDSGD